MSDGADSGDTHVPIRAMKDAELRQEWRRGWKMILASAVGAATTISMFNITAGLFLQPIQDETGWSRSAVTITSIIFFCTAILSVPGGYLLDRLGARRTTLFGMAALSAGLIGYALLPINKFTFYGLALFIGVISPFIGFSPFSKGVAAWFRRGFGGALGLTFSGPSIVAFIAVPLISAAIYSFGWRAGYLTLAGLTLLIGIPVMALLFRDRPPEAQMTPSEPETILEGASLREAMRDWRWWGALLVIAICAVAFGGYMVHLIPIMMARDVALPVAVSMGVLYAMCASVGRIGGGFLLDRFEPHAVMALFFALAGSGSVLIAFVPAAFIAIPVAAIAFGTGAEGDYLAFFTKRYFGTRAYGVILGSLTVAGTFAIGAGAFTYSWLFDRTDSYLYACLLGGACFLIGGILTAAMGILDRQSRRRAGRRIDVADPESDQGARLSLF